LVAVALVIGVLPRRGGQDLLRAETESLITPTVVVVAPKPEQSPAKAPLPAEIKPLAEAPIYARASGFLKQRYVDIGSVVEAGQLLAEIDTPELNQDLERARGLLAQAEVSRELTKATGARWSSLIKTGSVSIQENAEKQADMSGKAAAAESARAEVRRLEKLQAFARVTAPFAGIITARNVDTGDLIVAAGSKEIFHLAQTSKLRVYVQVSQAMARGVTIGQSAEVLLPELPGRTFAGTVVRNAGIIAADSRTLLVELEMDNKNGEVLAGSFAQVRFTEARIAPTLVLPANTVVFRAEGPQVFVAQPDGTVALRKVKLGRDFGQKIEMLTGVTAQDRVLLNPPESLADGATVNVAEAPSPEKKQ
jgi:RND family efflux transporter MFP subunit